jgi:hypothetical protein
MQAAQDKPFMQRHMVWLLWLALLLPLAQTAAGWHVLSHLSSGQAAEPDEQQAVHQAHCELCLSAAALIGGAPLASLPNLFHPRVMAEVLAADVRSVASMPAVRAYESRAPPFLQH